MPCYLGFQGPTAKARWITFSISFVLGTAFLAAGWAFAAPGLQTLAACKEIVTQGAASEGWSSPDGASTERDMALAWARGVPTDRPSGCFQGFFDAYGMSMLMGCIGAALLAVAGAAALCAAFCSTAPAQAQAPTPPVRARGSVSSSVIIWDISQLREIEESFGKDGGAALGNSKSKVMMGGMAPRRDDDAVTDSALGACEHPRHPPSGPPSIYKSSSNTSSYLINNV